MKTLLLGTVFSALASAAFAADVPVPVYKAAPATVVTASGWYLSVDGSWRRVNLPDYALGFRQTAAGPFTDNGPFTTFRDQRFDGYLVRGTVGYFLPSSRTIFGANSRLEIGGQFGRASGTNTAAATYTGGAVISQFLDGTTTGSGYICDPAQICRTNTNLSTKYSDWQLHGKIAGDYRAGAVLVTPSLAVFGGNARTNQTLVELLNVGGAANPGIYNASTSLRWNDVGARAGLDLKVDVTPWATIGLSGTAGFAARHVSLSGSDVAVDNITGGALLDGASTLSVSANTTPFLANAEAGVAFKWVPALIVRGFVGLNYDSKVPGISSPRFGGVVGAPAPATPATISFHSQTSYYAGGGVTWAFNAPAP